MLIHLCGTFVERQGDHLDATVVFNTLCCTGSREFLLGDREARYMYLHRYQFITIVEIDVVFIVAASSEEQGKACQNHILVHYYMIIIKN